MPKRSSPMSASPETFSRTRRNATPLCDPAAVISGQAGLASDLLGEVVVLLLQALAELEPDEPPHADVLAQLGHQLLLQVADGLGVVLHPRLLEQADLLHPLGDLALDDLVHHLGRLAALGGGRPPDAALLL